MDRILPCFLAYNQMGLSRGWRRWHSVLLPAELFRLGKCFRIGSAKFCHSRRCSTEFAGVNSFAFWFLFSLRVEYLVFFQENFTLRLKIAFSLTISLRPFRAVQSPPWSRSLRTPAPPTQYHSLSRHSTNSAFVGRPQVGLK